MQILFNASVTVALLLLTIWMTVQTFRYEYLLGELLDTDKRLVLLTARLELADLNAAEEKIDE